MKFSSSCCVGIFIGVLCDHQTQGASSAEVEIAAGSTQADCLAAVAEIVEAAVDIDSAESSGVVAGIDSAATTAEPCSAVLRSDSPPD